MEITHEFLESLEKQKKNDELAYKQYMKTLKREDHKTNCVDCGRFLEKERWIPKIRAGSYPICFSCRSNYDDPDFM